MLPNPFFLTSKIPSHFFCDRVEETATLQLNITNGINTVLISPRRMGKSGLIFHCFEDNAIRKDFSTLYVDILQASTLKEFVYLFGKAVFDNLVPKTIRWTSLFMRTLKSMSGKFSVDPISGLPSFNLMLGEIEEPLLTLEEIFKYIEQYNKRCVIAIDEFQQITKFPEKNTEAILRSHIQRLNNAAFIFSGSERHIMTQMFSSHSRPFYQSATFIVLDAIDKWEYVGFAQRLFEERDKKIEREAIARLYDLFDGFTFYMQRILNQCFSSVGKGECCGINMMEMTLHNILESESTPFRTILSNISERQKALLYAIAIEGNAKNITSLDFIKRYKLLGSSPVQSAAIHLLEKDFISRHDNTYYVTDKFLALWIKQHYGNTSTFLH